MKEQTFYGESDLKQSLLNYTKEHQLADSYIRGSWLNGEKSKNGSKKGCFYGCMTQSEDNTLEKASEQYGLPLWYVHVTEKIYEGLPEGEWLEFPYQAIEVIPVGIDMNMVRSRFNYRLLENQLQFCNGSKEVENAIKQCMALYSVPFNKIYESAAEAAAWSAWSARSAARSAASSAAEAAAEAAWSAASSAAVATASSARSAASSARSAAWSAAWSAAESARSAAWSAAESNYHSWMRDMLFDCIREEETKNEEVIKTNATLCKKSK